MLNLDAIKQKKTDILASMASAMKDEDTEKFSQAFSDLSDLIQGNILEQVHEESHKQDEAILSQRGCHVLTSAEKKYYEAVIDGMRGAEPRQSISNVNVVMPETVINAVFEDIQKEHPLLSAIDFQNTEGLVKMLLSTNGGVASWAAIGTTVDSELSGNFTEIDLTAGQLTAYIPVAKYMLELGPQWMDTYVRQILTEAMAVQLEVGIVDGTGKNQPIGMDRKLTGAVDGVYPKKDATQITDLGPATFGTILNELATDKNGKKRSVGEIIMVVNPTDYFTKIFPAITPRAADGTFNKDVFPYPVTCIQSAAVASGEAIFGIGSKYFLGCGVASTGGKLEYSDDVKFLERQRVYLTYLYGNGRALDEHAFMLCDISGMQDYALPVVQVDGSDARLSALAVGSLTLSPAFDKNIYEYTAATTNATNVLSATAKDGDATVAIKNGSTTVASGAAATWTSGANAVTVTVTNGTAVKTYKVTVTKS